MTTFADSDRKKIVESAQAKFKNFDVDYGAIAAYMKTEILAYARSVLGNYSTFGRTKKTIMFGNPVPLRDMMGPVDINNSFGKKRKGKKGKKGKTSRA
jgi:hypothetical protein